MSKQGGKTFKQKQKQRNLLLAPRDKLYWEKQLWGQDLQYVAGLDEAGRGAWAGPVSAAAVIFSPGTILPQIDDSKKFTPQKRDELYDLIIKNALAYSVSLIYPPVIDEINILEASLLAMRKAVDELNLKPDYLLVDGQMGLNIPIPHRTIVRGDSLSQSIGAASIIAKVTRDRFMIKLEEEYPQFQFSKHKGYGTLKHQQELKQYGYLSCHRKSFEPIKSMIC